MIYKVICWLKGHDWVVKGERQFHGNQIKLVYKKWCDRCLKPTKISKADLPKTNPA